MIKMCKQIFFSNFEFGWIKFVTCLTQHHLSCNLCYLLWINNSYTGVTLTHHFTMGSSVIFVSSWLWGSEQVNHMPNSSYQCSRLLHHRPAPCSSSHLGQPHAPLLYKYQYKYNCCPLQPSADHHPASSVSTPQMHNSQ